MRVSLAILLSLAVLAALFLPAIEAAATRRRAKSRAVAGRTRARTAGVRRGGRARMQARRGRQDEGAEPAAPPAEGGEEGEEEIPTWCNPEDPMGAWLLFKVNKAQLDFLTEFCKFFGQIFKS